MTRSGLLHVPRLLVLCGLLAAQVGCGTLKYNVPSSNAAPGADAKVTAHVHEKQRQTMLEVEATNLSPPARVNPASTQYVAWYRHDSSAAWSRIGTLDYDEGDRKAMQAGSVPEVAFDLKISAEPENLPGAPSDTVMFSQRVEDD